MGAQSQSLNALYKSSIEAYEKGDFAQFKNLNLQAYSIHPSHPTVLYNTALAYDHLEQIDSCIFFLKK